MIIAAASLATAMIMHYFLPCTETDFWINVCLGIFGSAFLTILTSIMSYNHEKEKTLERFLYHTRQILTVANKYQEHMTLEEKIRFFLEYSEFDKIAWDADFGNMSFFSEKITHNQKYIYCSIYKRFLISTKLLQIIYGILDGILMKVEKTMLLCRSLWVNCKVIY